MAASVAPGVADSLFRSSLEIGGPASALVLNGPVSGFWATTDGDRADPSSTSIAVVGNVGTAEYKAFAGASVSDFGSY